MRLLYKATKSAKIKKESPCTEILIQSVLPVTTKYNMFQEHTSHWQEIPDINQAIFNICQKENVKYIDLFTHFVDDNGQMKPEYTNDGLHLLGKGYMLWKEIITPYLKK
jgi:lysophospholipase L1-like esterase